MPYKLRNSSENGQWLLLLLPLCLLPARIKFQSAGDRLDFILVSWLCVSQFIKKVIYLKKSSIFDPHYVFHAILSIPASFVISMFTALDMVTLYLIFFAAALSYNYLISKLLLNCHGSFTLGEAQVIVQGLVQFLFCVLISLGENEYYSSEIKHHEAMNLLKLLLLGLFLLVCSLYLVPSVRKGIKFHFVCGSFAAVMVIIWSFYHQKNVILWFGEFCTYNYRRIYLLQFWFILTLASVAFVAWKNKRPAYTASTLDRKYFHIIIDAVYISGVIYDVQFLCFASGIAFGAFIVMEIYRILNVPVIGPAIGHAFHIFLDEKDSGVLILTHIYLLIGCSCPIWLSSQYLYRNEFHICLLSGIISVGFGDTFAAIGGTLFGKNCWKGSKRTLEGTACAIIAQFISSFFFMNMGHKLSLFNISLLSISVLLTSLLEAKTDQVDNLVLPLFMMSMLSWIN